MYGKRLVSILTGVFMYLIITGISGLYSIRAQETAPEGSGKTQESDAIRCWWRSDKSAIRVGDNFVVVLTCRVIETENEKVIVSEDALEPAVVSFTPYQLVDGARYQDIRRNETRFFQYQYRLKIIGEDFFGKDVPIPALEIHYRIERKLTGLENINTKENIYKLPELPIKVHSLVTKDAKDIRDVSDETFGVIKDRRFKANLAFVLGGLLFVIPLMILISPLVRSARKLKNKYSNGTLFSTTRLLGRMLGELRNVRDLRNNNGWDSELIGKTVTVLRIAGAIALSKNISQLSARFETRGLEGQLKLRKGLLKPKKVMICSNLTPESMRNGLDESLNRKWSEEFLKVFEIFNGARYSADVLDDYELDAALFTGIVLIRKLHFRHFWLVRKTIAARSGFKGLRPSWTRARS